MQSGRSGGERVVGVASVIADGSALLRARVFWFLLLTVPDEDLRLNWVLTLVFGLVCIAAAASLRRLLLEAFVSPGPVSYSSALLVTSLWAFISAGLMSACELQLDPSHADTTVHRAGHVAQGPGPRPCRCRR